MITRKCDCGSDSFEMEQMFDRKTLWCQKCGLGVSINRQDNRINKRYIEFNIDSLDEAWNTKNGVYQMWGQVALKRFREARK